MKKIKANNFLLGNAYPNLAQIFILFNVLTVNAATDNWILD